ncbi:hypothetical protein LCGC14_0990180 [marine sediment metagenome]|uniref:Uncharacterized protein n=1 Tax=marine sediment metagenome TaxID=412755 RepID=A0A0F9QPD8_9ZZZZ
MIVSLGQTSRSLDSIFAGISPGDIHEAINYALGTVRVVVTPTGDPWRVSQSMFDRMIDLTLQKLAQLDPASAGTISRAEMGAYIIERGYISSAPPPPYALPTATPAVLVTPVVPPMPTLIVSPVPYTPPIRTVVIQPRPEPIYEPPTVEPEQAGDSNAIFWIVGAVVGGLILLDTTKPRGGRYERHY